MAGMTREFRTARDLERLVIEMEPGVTQTELRTAVLLLAAPIVGISRVQGFTSYRVEFVHRVRRNLVKNGIWKTNGMIHTSNWDHEKTGVISFWLDVQCGLGKTERVTDMGIHKFRKAK